jgi:uncharacterized membrane protein
MDILFKVMLALHILGGSTGLITGAINLIRKKGDKNHRTVGKIFTLGMLTAGSSSLLLAVMHPSYFLFNVGVFTIYLVGTGKRYIHAKMMGKGEGPGLIDWALTIGMMLSGLVLAGFGVNHLVNGNNFGVVFIVFAFVGLRAVKSDFDNYRGKPKEKNFWLLAHIVRMTAGYIAASTAFLVVNFKYLPIELPAVVVWLLPTVIFTPLIVRWSRKHQVQ